MYTSNLAKAGVTAFEERAEIVDAHTVKLGKSGSEVTAERILVATGGGPIYPEDCPGSSSASRRTKRSCWRSFRGAY